MNTTKDTDNGSFASIREGEKERRKSREFFSTDHSGQLKQEGNDEYNAFVEKFEHKRTSDDCYTPKPIYDALCAWIENRYKVDRSCFVRPFYPGGDYERYPYSPESIVVDNPPFSILAKIKRFYVEHKIRFFLFAPHLTLFSGTSEGLTYIVCGADIRYENGAVVNTDFITNLESPEILAFAAPDLSKALHEIQYQSKPRRRVYILPDEVITSTKMEKWAKAGFTYVLMRNEAVRIRALDSMKEDGREIFGCGFLVSRRQAELAAEAGRLHREVSESDVFRYGLSEREQMIVDSLKPHI